MLNNSDARNDIVIFITESSDHDRVACMICLQKVVHEIEHMHKRTCENVYVWSDGMRSQFRSHNVFKLLASKGAMDGIGGTVKNVILSKVKSGQLMVNSPLEIFEIFKRWKENVVKIAILKSFFFKNSIYEDPFPVQWYGNENEIICGNIETSEGDDECAECQGSDSEGEEWLCCPVCRQWYHEDCFL